MLPETCLPRVKSASFARTTMGFILLFMAAVCLLIQPLPAQIGGQGSITGTLTDPSGAVIAGAT